MIAVERFSFFDVQGGHHLRYVEHSPPEFHRDHAECGCTKNVSSRPSGRPSNVHQEFYVDDPAYCHQLSRRWLTFGATNGAHAYFMFGGARSISESSVKIEITMPGHGLTDCFFGSLYLGNRIDVSRFVNGHSPSEIVKLDEIAPDQLWVHDCNWGREAIRHLPDDQEAVAWRNVFALVRKIDEQVMPLIADLESSVDALRARLEANDKLVMAAYRLKDRLSTIIVNFRESELFHICNEVFLDAHQMTPSDLQKARQEFHGTIARLREPLPE